jgi:alpha-galactosidase
MKNSFINLFRQPDDILVQTQDSGIRFEEPEEHMASPTKIEYIYSDKEARVIVHPCKVPLKRIKLRWNNRNFEIERVLNDCFDRCTNNLAWDCMKPDRELPWYFATYDGERTHCYGVKTGCNSLCFWQIDPYGVSLWLDIRNGGNGVELIEPLTAAIVTCREGEEGETAFTACQKFCKIMCDAPKMPKQPVFGVNNWYWAYGNITYESVMKETAYLAELASDAVCKPYMVIDDGWQPLRHNNSWGNYIGGPWNGCNMGFTDMEKTAYDIAEYGCIPGIWFRALLTAKRLPDEILLQRPAAVMNCGQVMDPSNPETLHEVFTDARRISDWGFKLIKHDFSTSDITGGIIASDGWNFYDRTKTTAQITKKFYETIQQGANDAIVIGCNTYSHLTAGIHEIHRSGGDTSGRLWEYTRRNGVNSFMRLIQNGTFFNIDPDCAAFTERVSNKLNIKFLELCAITGSTTLASITPGILNDEEKRKVRDIYKIASMKGNCAEPLDWLNTNCPSRFLYKGKEYIFDWYSGYNGVRMFPTWMA